MVTSLQDFPLAVAPTPTDTPILDVRDSTVVCASVKNNSATETVTGVIYSSVWNPGDSGPSTLGDLVGIGPLEVRRVDISKGAAHGLFFRFTSTGAGANVVINAKRDDRGAT